MQQLLMQRHMPDFSCKIPLAAALCSHSLFFIQANLHGLTNEEAAARLIEYGPNKLPESTRNPILIYFGYMWNPLSWAMEAAAVLAICLLDYADFALIVGLLLINCTISFYEESNADAAIKVGSQHPRACASHTSLLTCASWPCQAGPCLKCTHHQSPLLRILLTPSLSHPLQALAAALAPKAKALRSGKVETVDSVTLVPGDVIIVRLGDIVPADIKILQEDEEGNQDDETPMQVDQAALTGESLPVKKFSGGVCFSGSAIKQGERHCVVYATGSNTFFGR